MVMRWRGPFCAALIACAMIGPSASSRAAAERRLRSRRTVAAPAAFGQGRTHRRSNDHGRAKQCSGSAIGANAAFERRCSGRRRSRQWDDASAAECAAFADDDSCRRHARFRALATAQTASTSPLDLAAVKQALDLMRTRADRTKPPASRARFPIRSPAS